MITPRRTAKYLPHYLALAALGLSMSMLAACSEEFELPNQDARIEAVGDIEPPVEGCEIFEEPAEEPSADAGADAGSDAGLDAGIDAGSDAGSDAGNDPGSDVGIDAGTDAGPDASSDAGTDAGAQLDAGSDAGADAGTDAGAQPDAGSTASFEVKISRDGDAVSIPYLIVDREGDDQNIRVEICLWNGESAGECGVAAADLGGDGTTFVPTSPAGQCVLHVFNWDVGCGRFTGVADGGEAPQRATVEVDRELVARISVVGSDETPSRSEPFTLKALGFDALPPCD
jgi:hypothetical protein